MNEIIPFCSHIMRDDLREARLTLERRTEYENDPIFVTDLRRRLEYAFDNYNHLKTSESKILFRTVLKQIKDSHMRK